MHRRVLWYREAEMVKNLWRISAEIKIRRSGRKMKGLNDNLKMAATAFLLIDRRSYFSNNRLFYSIMAHRRHAAGRGARWHAKMLSPRPALRHEMAASRC